jgi:hypothetical protein
MADRFLPQQAVTLPTPEGFATLDAPDKLHAMRELRTDPATDPYVLQGVAWDVLADAFYDQQLPNPKLLPEARHTLQAIIDRREELPADDPNLYLNSRLALIGYDVFKAVLEKRELSDNSRLTMGRHAGRLLHDVAAPVDYNLDELDMRAARKMYEAMVIGMVANRYRAPIATAVTAPPTMHNLYGIDPGTGTSDFSMYILRQNKVAPTAISKFTDHHMFDPTRHRGVVQLSLGPLLMNTGRSIPSIHDERRTKGSISDSQRWLMQAVARTMARHAVENVPVPDDYALLMDLAARFIGIRVGKYDPEGLNAPVNDRHR